MSVNISIVDYGYVVLIGKKHLECKGRQKFFIFFFFGTTKNFLKNDQNLMKHKKNKKIFSAGQYRSINRKRL